MIIWHDVGNVVNRDGTERGNPRLGDSVVLGANCVISGQSWRITLVLVPWPP